MDTPEQQAETASPGNQPSGWQALVMYDAVKVCIGLAALPVLVVLMLGADLTAMFRLKPVTATVRPFSPPAWANLSSDDAEQRWRSKVYYRYQVDGAWYDGHSDSSRASQFKPGDRIAVWFNPGNPSESALSNNPSMSTPALLMVILMLPAALVLWWTGRRVSSGRASYAHSQPRRSGGLRRAAIYMAISILSAAAHLFLSPAMGSRKAAWSIGVAWAIVGIPLTALLIRAAFRKPASGRLG